MPLKKNSGRNGQKRGKKDTPYSANDFDCLWVHLVQNRQFFFVIPAHELIEHDVLVRGMQRQEKHRLFFEGIYKTGKGTKEMGRGLDETLLF